MTSRAARLSQWIDRSRRERSLAERSWLRQGRVEQTWVSGVRQLLSDEGAELFEDAKRERVWNAAELRGVAEQRAWLAFEAGLAPAAALAAELVLEPFALPFGREQPAGLVSGLLGSGSLEGREQRANALASAAQEIAPRLIELRNRALEAHAREQPAPASTPSPASTPQQLAAAAQSGALDLSQLAALPAEAWQAAGIDPRALVSTLQPSAAGVLVLPPSAAGSAAPPSPAARAAQLLADTDDAARELSRWLVRAEAPGRTIPWHVLLRALRAPELDGLAKPARRWARVAQPLRGLGFDRDLDARLRAESAPFAYEPRACVLALDAPGDVRVSQSALDFGLAADVYAARGVAEGMAVALVSPALASVLRWPLAPGIAAALGAAFMQLRADHAFLRRFENLEAPWLERAARHAALILLFELRVEAARLVAEQQTARDETEQVRQLAAALERALGAELPASLGVLFAYAAAPGGSTFDALLAGLAVHVALRDRFDADWYRNPRVADVLRGAAARGNTLELPALLEELNVSPNAGSQRLLELLG